MYRARRLRRFLNLRLVDVSRNVGINPDRFSQAERGIVVLDAIEELAIENFLRRKFLEQAGNEQAALALESKL